MSISPAARWNDDISSCSMFLASCLPDTEILWLLLDPDAEIIVALAIFAVAAPISDSVQFCVC